MRFPITRSSSKPPWAALTTQQRVVFVLKWSAIGGLAMGAFSAALIAIMFWVYGSDPNLPRISSLADYAPAEVSRVLTEDGQVIGEIYEQRRTYVPFEKLPPALVNAFVSAEDANFFKHKGIDYMGMLRALLVNIKSGEHKQGGSTITQQVVKNLLLTRDKTLKRKFQEIILARRLENHLTKNEILTLYANEIFFGADRYGVQEASQYYFGKDVSNLNVGEAAMLAGLPQAPSRYSPKREENRVAAKQRQVYVLDQMAKHGFLTREEAQKWVNEPLKVVASPYPTLGSAPEWVELVRAELERRYGKDEVKRVGVDATTTMDLKVQTAATEALRKGLLAYDQRRGYGRPLRTLKGKAIDNELQRMAKRVPKKGPTPGLEYPAIVRKVGDDGMTVDLGKYEAQIALTMDKGRHNPLGKKPGERFKNGDVVRVMAIEVKEGEKSTGDRTVILAPGPEGAVVVINPENRHLLAVVGGYDSRALGFNRATMAKRQAGSTFKPFVYAAAIDSGDFTAASIVNDAPEVYDLWKPENYNKGEFQGPVRIRHALAHSINTVAIRVANDISPARVSEVARSMGIESSLPQTLSLALGSGEVTPLELTNAFATFAAGGRVAPPQVIKKLASDRGKDVPPPPSFRQALRPDVSYIVLDMMRTVVQSGTGAKAGSLHMDIAGKTGTSNDARDAWFVGLSPEYAVGVWVGFDDFRRALGGGESGSHTALPIYIDVMKTIGKRTSRFSKPAGVAEALIDDRTGLLAAPGTTIGAYTEVFVDGTVPVEVAPLPGEVEVQDYVTDEYADPEARDPNLDLAPALDAGTLE